MAIETVLPISLFPGAIATRSTTPLDTVSTRTWTAALQFSGLQAAALLADPTLRITMRLYRVLDPLRPEPVAVAEWAGGGNAAPQVVWTGLARQVYLVLDPSRPASVGATISY